jgi:hypothetical protein
MKAHMPSYFRIRITIFPVGSSDELVSPHFFQQGISRQEIIKRRSQDILLNPWHLCQFGNYGDSILNKGFSR